MKIWIQTCLMLLELFVSSNKVLIKAQSTDLTAFEWLIGKWERTDTRVEHQSFEAWIRVSDSLYTGTGWTMNGKDSIFVEGLRLFTSEKSYFYEATVTNNSGPVRFEMIRWDDSGFESVNPEHDFPKKIRYHFDQIGNLKVTISDQKKEIHFQFRKLE